VQEEEDAEDGKDVAVAVGRGPPAIESKLDLVDNTVELPTYLTQGR
jgi:hypothetical protein